MYSRALWLGMALALVSSLGCQPPKNQANINSSRTARGGLTGRGAVLGYGKSWGEITSDAGDQVFWQELNNLTSPALSGLSSDDQLGYVSSQSGQNTGVRFWGNARVFQNSQIDPSSLMIRLEIYDDRAGQIRSDGTSRPNIPIQISSDQPTYVTAGGSMQGGQVYLWFQDVYGTIMLSGYISGQTFSGQIGYQDSATGNQPRTLGNFTVPASGFFQ